MWPITGLRPGRRGGDWVERKVHLKGDKLSWLWERAKPTARGPGFTHEKETYGQNLTNSSSNINPRGCKKAFLLRGEPNQEYKSDFLH